MVIPLYDDNSQVRRIPGVTWTLIILNCLVYLYWLLTKTPIEIQHGFFQFGVVPMEYTLRQDLPPFIPLPYWATLFSMLFIHGGLGHLFGNMLYLWIFGDNVEQFLGHWGFLAFYLMCGIGATLFHVGANSHSFVPSVGASGAISGVLAAYVILFPRQRVVLGSIFGLFSVSALLIIAFWMIFQAFNALMIFLYGNSAAGIAYMAHLGGFLIGIPLTLMFRAVHYYQDGRPA